MNNDILQLEQLILRTPFIPFHTVDKELASRIYLKPENLQLFGSYKIRGIVSVLKSCDPHALQAGISAASAGNMAQAVAFSAQKLNISSRIYLPESAPQNKKIAIQQLGAEIVQLPYQDIWKIVSGETTPPDDRMFIHPALNESLLKGYSTIAHEMLEDMPDMDAVVIPFGVGGLTLGIARALSQLKSEVAIYACEPETAAPLKASLLANQSSSIHRIPSFVDAIGTPEVLPPVFQQLLPILNDSLVISLNDIKQALKMLYFKHKLICEGAAACSLAAAIQLAKQSRYQKIACILSGGNIDNDVLNTSIM